MLNLNTSLLPDEFRALNIDMEKVYINQNPTNVVEEYHFVYLQVPNQGKCLIEVGTFTDGSHCFGDPDPDDLEEFKHLINDTVFPVSEYGFSDVEWLENFGNITWEYSNL